MMALRQAPDALYKSFRPEPGLRPVARPVDTFVQTHPDPTAGSELAQLADALKSLQPKLTAYFDSRREELIEKEIAEGVKAYEENRKAWTEYLKEHPEHAGYSPHFQKGYRSMWFREQARRMAQEKMDAYSKGVMVDVGGRQVNIQEVEDAQAFEDWSGSFNKTWVETHLGQVDSLEFAEYFLPVVSQFDSQLLQSHIAQRAEAYKVGYREAFSNEIIQAGLEALSRPEFATPTGKHQVLQEFRAKFEALLNKALSEGLPTRQANDLAVEALIRAAETAGGFEGMALLEVLEEVKAGTGPLGKIGKYKAAIKEAQEHIEERYMGLEAKRWNFEQLKKDREIEAVIQKYWPSMWADPMKNWDKEIEEVARTNWKAAEALRSYLGAIRSSHALDVRGQPVRVVRGGGGGGAALADSLSAKLIEIEDAVATGEISPAEGNKILQAIIARGTWGPKEQKLLQKTISAINKRTKSTLNSVVSRIDPLLKNVYLKRDLVTGQYSVESLLKYREARAAFITRMAGHISTIESGDPTKLEAKADEVLKDVFKYYPNDPLQTSNPPSSKAPQPQRAPATFFSRLKRFLLPGSPPPKAPPAEVGHFKDSKEYLKAVVLWEANPKDPANPINVLAKKTGLSPKEYILQQGNLYRGPDGKPLADRIKRELKF